MVEVVLKPEAMRRGHIQLRKTHSSEAGPFWSSNLMIDLKAYHNEITPPVKGRGVEYWIDVTVDVKKGNWSDEEDDC